MNDYTENNIAEPGEPNRSGAETERAEPVISPTDTAEPAPGTHGYGQSAEPAQPGAGSFDAPAGQETPAGAPQSAPPPPWGPGWNAQGYPQGYYPPPPPPYYGGMPQGQGGYPPPYPGAFAPPQPYYGNGGYRYDPHAGWQAAPRQDMPRPDGAYESWKPYEYETDLKKGGRRRSRGVVVFLTCLALLIALTVTVGPLFAAFKSTGDAGSASSSTNLEGVEETASPKPTDPSGELHISGRPEVTEDAADPTGRLTIPGVAKKVLPSVVGVLQYDNTGIYYKTIGMGSGIIMTQDGYIITNAHVVSQGTEFKVELHDGTAYDAVVVGYDMPTDLALLKINAEGLTPAQFGDSNSLEVGEAVVAIGNPVSTSFAGSVTMGIVSALNRKVQTSTYEMTFIQTDAAINPGNSGGALANEYGQVIGINTSKITGEGYEGIGFAIPISEAKPILDDILQNGRVTGRARLGVTVQMVDEINAREEDLPLGLVIIQVDETADIARRGVVKYDIITHVNGGRIYTMSDLRSILDAHLPGDVVTLTLYRRLSPARSQELEVQVRLMEDAAE